MLNPDIDYELENVRNLVSRKPKTKLPKIEKETTLLVEIFLQGLSSKIYN